MRSSSLALLLLLLLAAPLAASPQGDPRLDEARSLFGQNREPVMRQAADLCLAVGDAEAMEVLMRELKGPNPHSRDIVWEAMKRFTDPYAWQVVEHELKTNKQQPRVRQWCAQLLGIYGEDSMGGTLAKAMKDKESSVRYAAARSLGQLGFAPGVKALASAAGDKAPMLRANALEALVRIEPENYAKRFLAALADKDGGVRCALLGLTPELFPAEAEALATTGLTDEDWRPRLQAVENLGAIKTKTSVDGLIEATGDGRPRVAQAAGDRLRAMTGMAYARQEQWRAWWAKARESFEFPEGTGQGQASAADTVATYNGIRVSSDHIAFLLDISKDMVDPRTSDQVRKIDAAVAELQRVLEMLEGEMVFNAHLYSDQVEAIFKEPEELSKRSRKKALAELEDASLKGYKNIWGALEAVVSDPQLDTVYLLSAGEPEVGLYVHWNRVTEHLMDLNRFHKVVVHTVAYSGNDWYREQLKKIAEVTGGDYAWFD
ncbi:MAG: HEAT repeat domain-containing protein [Planctomycetes bacterium]|nr:HEAT repeat domain-containing protein [Planctomycetota bacterium]MBL7008014.1 HEAT repeat domain-containing protein [Planctomycetota bacterium]